METIRNVSPDSEEKGKGKSSEEVDKKVAEEKAETEATEKENEDTIKQGEETLQESK